MITVAVGVLLLLSTVTITSGAETVKVLVDESRVGSYEDAPYSFDNNVEDWGFGNAGKAVQSVASMDIKKKGKLGYSTLKNYDVLIIASFEESYSSSEVEAIKKFVENGGGLLFMGDIESSNNSVSRAFDVLFSSETVIIADKKAESFRASDYQFFVTDIKSHPVTRGVDQIALNGGIPITSYGSGTVLAETSSDSWADVVGEGLGKKDTDEDEGPFDILLAVEMGKGRAVFFGSASSLYNWVTGVRDQQNLELIENAVEWLGEPGGPYQQYKTINEQAQNVLTEAESLYEGHQFSQAKTKFGEAIDVFEESNGIYQNPEANEGIETANDYIEKCETGIEADSIFDTALDLYDNREYENAITEFERAKPLYQEIEYTERAQECDTKVSESNNWIALRDEATSLFQKGEDALTTAPSTFSPAGYEEAKSLFEQSKSKWEEYNDPAQVSACNEKIRLCNDEIGKIKNNRMMVIIAVVVIIGVVVVVIIVVRRRKPKVEAAPEIPAAPPGIPEKPPEVPREADALEALKKRYAKGEITKEEYEKLKAVLEET